MKYAVVLEFGCLATKTSSDTYLHVHILFNETRQLIHVVWLMFNRTFLEKMKQILSVTAVQKTQVVCQLFTL